MNLIKADELKLLFRAGVAAMLIALNCCGAASRVWFRHGNTPVPCRTHNRRRWFYFDKSRTVPQYVLETSQTMASLYQCVV